MKKTLLILGVVLVLILGNVTAALADAATYDMEQADYYVYVATPDGGLNMRHGPGTEYEKVMAERIPDGVRLYIGYTSGNWGYTTYNGNSGWVALRQTATTPPAPVQTPVPAPAVETPEQEEIKDTVQDTSKENTEASEPIEENFEDAEAVSEDSEIVKNAMMNQIVLIVGILILVIVSAILVLIVVNMKARK